MKHIKGSESEFERAGKALRGMKLSAAEKRSMLADIYRSKGEAPASKASPFVFSTFFDRQYYLAGIAVLISMIGGTAYASASSLPGDPLYAVKVSVIEPVALALHLDESSKNEYRITLLRERVEEIQALKTEGRLHYDIEKISAAAAQENVKDIETSAAFDPAGTNMEVSGHIDAYNAIVEESLRLQTVIQKTLSPDEDEKTDEREDRETKSDDDPVLLAPEDIAGDIDGLTQDVEEVLTDGSAALKSTMEETLEETEAVTEPIAPILDQIGL